MSVPNMLVLSVLGAFLWSEVAMGVSGQTDAAPYDTKLPSFFIPAKKSDAAQILPVDPNGSYNFNAAHQSFYLNGPLVIQRSGEENNTEKEIRSDYKVTKGIGAHKVHTQKVTWNRARRTCHEEGGHLVIVRSAAEEKVILQMMHEQQVATAWFGFHDQYEEGDWISVLDEPMAEVGWAVWANLGHPNPDNAHGGENCAEYKRDAKGMNDAGCHGQFPFVCKISV